MILTFSKTRSLTVPLILLNSARSPFEALIVRFLILCPAPSSVPEKLTGVQSMPDISMSFRRMNSLLGKLFLSFCISLADEISPLIKVYFFTPISVAFSHSTTYLNWVVPGTSFHKFDSFSSAKCSLLPELSGSLLDQFV